MNYFKELLDIEQAKKIIAMTPKDEVTILIPHYSINIQSKYEDGEDCDNDFTDLEDELGVLLYVNDYDDLCANPHDLEIF